MKSLICCLLSFLVFTSLHANAENMCSSVSTSAASGSLFDSGGSGSNYQNDEDCYFIIQPANADSVTLDVTLFESEDRWDYLEIYDGTTTSSPLIDHLTGSETGSYTANSGAMLVYFHSDFSVTTSGFEAAWSSASASQLSGNLHVDNVFEAYISTDDSVQGTLLSSGSDWPTMYNLASSLTPGQDYYLHIKGTDAGGVAGFLGDFEITGTDHTFSNGLTALNTNTADWVVSTAGWSNYQPASGYGVNGVAPWYTRSGVDAGAQWIWSSNNDADNVNYFSTKIIPTNTIPSTCSGTGTLNAVGIKINNVGRNTRINTTTEALAIHAAWLAAGSPASGLIDGSQYNVAASGSSTVDRIDFGGSAHDFSGTLSYPGVAAGVSGSDFLVHASGLLSLPAGDYTIFVESDDGFSFVMNTLSGDTVSFNKFGRPPSGGSNELRFENPTGNSNTGGSFTLSQDSVFDIAAIFFERGGGDYLEISIANNIRTSSAPNGYEILRDGALNDKVKFRECAVSPPTPVLEYRFDSCNWADAQDVVDSGPNGLNAYSVGGVLSTSGGQVCGLARFDGVNDYVRLPDTNEVDLPDTLTVTAWVEIQNAAGLKTIVSKDTNYEFHIDQRQVYWWWTDSNGNERDFDSGRARLSLNTWHHVAITYRSGLQVMYIDGQEVASQTYTGQLRTNNNELQIGQDQGVGSGLFDGDIDEVKIFDGALSSLEIKRIFDNEAAGLNYDGTPRVCNCIVVAVDHYAISHDQSMVSCLTEDITFTAHDTGDLAVDAEDALLQISTTTGKGEWLSVVSGLGVLNNLGNGQASYQFPNNGETSVTLRFSYPDIASDPEVVNFDVTDGAATDKRNSSHVEDKDLPVSDSGLVFSIPDTESCQSSVVVNLQAVKKSDSSLSCASAAAGNQTVNFYSQYLTPSSGTQALTLNSGGTDYPLSTVAPGTSVPMVFNAQGEASMTVSYPDAGRVGLYAALTVGQKVLTGSDSFVVYPAQLSVSAETNAGVPLDNSSVSGGAVWAAARPFALEVSGQCAAGTVTPNYQPSNAELGASLHTPTQAAGGASGGLTVSAGSLTVNDAVGGWLGISTSFSNGIYKDTTARYSEVGIVNLYARDLDFYGHSINQTVTPVGRFIPWAFGVTANAPEWGAHCSSGGFSYLDEKLAFLTAPELKISGLNAVGGRVYNYGSSLWKLNAQRTARFYTDQSAAVSAALTSLVDSSVDTWGGTETDYDGEAINSLGNDAITYVRNALEAPFAGLTDLTFTIADLTDTEGVCYRIDSDTDGNWLEEVCREFTISDIPANELRFGRLALTDAYGPETEPLSVPWVIEYFDGADFITNTDDSCSAWLTSEVTYSDTEGVLIASAATVPTYAHAATDFRVDAGDAGLKMSAPGAGNTGVFGIAVDLTRSPYFLFDWDGDGNFDNPPSANIVFGQYRSNDRVIFQRQW